MPYKFRYAIPGHSFQCDLQCQQCISTNASGGVCKKRACIGVPFCWIHCLKHLHLRVLPSPIAGKGLFARSGRQVDPTKILFRRNDIVCHYEGERVTKTQINNRYGNNNQTAPYGLHIRGNRYENGACKRGIGSLANHSPHNNVVYKKLLIQGQWVGVLKAIRAIRDGQEVLSNYGSHFVFQNSHRTSTR